MINMEVIVKVVFALHQNFRTYLYLVVQEGSNMVIKINGRMTRCFPTQVKGNLEIWNLQEVI